VELITALFFVFLYRSFGISAPFLIYAIFGCSMIVLIFIDYYHRLLPWVITFPGIAIGFLSSFVNPFLTPIESGVGILLGAGILLFVFFLFKWVRKKEGLGDGDIVLLAMVGAFLGWQQVLLILFFSSMLGSVIGLYSMVVLRKGSDFPYPYGSFIGAAAIPAIFWGQKLWYLYITR
jgi:leader peptidase (prepilin peptidase)/N-methyltransferase